VLLGAQLVVPAMAITQAQVSFNVANLPAILAGCAAVIGASMATAAHLARAKVHREQTLMMTALAALLFVGGVLQAGAPTVWLWGVGSLLTGIGVGIAMFVREFSWSMLRGLIIGPFLGVGLSLISWRAVGALAIVNAALMLVVPIARRGFSGVTTTADTSAVPAKRSPSVAALIVFVSGAITFPAALFFVRNATILKETPLPIGIALTVGGLLGLWRGRRLAERGLARRSIRQGAWLVLIFGVGGGQLLRSFLSGPVPIVLAFIVSFGGSRILASATLTFTSNSSGAGSSARRVPVLAPLFAGLLVGVIPLATAGHESLLWQVREFKQSYPNAASLKKLDRGILSLPASFDVAQDPRVGALSGPIRSAAGFMTRQHLALTLLFSSGIAALLALIASFALPRQRRKHRSIESGNQTTGTILPTTTFSNRTIGAEV
jgi:hypothetical protein